MSDNNIWDKIKIRRPTMFNINFETESTYGKDIDTSDVFIDLDKAFDKRLKKDKVYKIKPYSYSWVSQNSYSWVVKTPPVSHPPPMKKSSLLNDIKSGECKKASEVYDFCSDIVIESDFRTPEENQLIKGVQSVKGSIHFDEFKLFESTLEEEEMSELESAEQALEAMEECDTWVYTGNGMQRPSNFWEVRLSFVFIGKGIQRKKYYLHYEHEEWVEAEERLFGKDTVYGGDTSEIKRVLKNILENRVNSKQSVPSVCPECNGTGEIKLFTSISTCDCQL